MGKGCLNLTWAKRVEEGGRGRMEGGRGPLNLPWVRKDKGMVEGYMAPVQAMAAQCPLHLGNKAGPSTRE